MRATALRLEGIFGRDKLPKPLSVAKSISVDVELFKKKLPLIRALCTEGLQDRHTRLIKAVLEQTTNFTGDEPLSTFADAANDPKIMT